MAYQIQAIVAPPAPMSSIKDYRANAITALAIYTSTARGEEDVFCVPLTKSDFEDRQAHKPRSREEILQLLPEKISYDAEIFQECLDTNDIASVRFDHSQMKWQVGPRPWDKTINYEQEEASRSEGK